MPKWLVTGGCGFIGTHLVRALLAQGDEVCVLDDLSTGKSENLAAGAALIVGDVADAGEVARALQGVDGCFHLAAIASVQRSTEFWVEAHRTNLTGTITLFERISKGEGAKIPVVYASSAAIYGNNEAVPLAESAQAIPLSAYGADKLSCELQGRVAWNVHRIPNTGLRFFNVYGAGQDPSSPYSGVITLFADRLSRGRALDVYGDGEQSRDFIYVGDVVAHLIAAMTRCVAGASVYNVCTGRSVSVLELAVSLSLITGAPLDIRHQPPRGDDIRRSLGDPRQAILHLQVSADTSLQEGLRLTYGD